MSHSSLDSIHPSTTGSPSTALSSPSLDPTTDPAMTSNLDDIFGSSPPDQLSATTTPTFTSTSTPATSAATATAPEPSDLPSLRRQHVTAGYRDGVAAAKTAHVQSGFDGGYPVGGEMGVRVGIVLGVLEGIARACEKKGENVGVEEVYEKARRELDVRSVFGGAMGGTFAGGDGKEGGMDVKERLARTGEEVIARWEGRVEGLLKMLK